MWDALASVFGGNNGAQAMIMVVFIILLAFVMVKCGMLRVDTRVVRLGAADGERRVLNEQFKWLHQYCSSREVLLNEFARKAGMDGLEYGGYFAKYICERVYDVCIQWAVLNHVRTDEEYVLLKQMEIWNLVRMLNPAPTFHTKEFKSILDGWTVEVIDNLMTIRKLYDKEV